eukprot:1315306-Alexandrium_andersonii.AAC.1
MSASLVGSEMCIRDRFARAICVARAAAIRGAMMLLAQPLDLGRALEALRGVLDVRAPRGTVEP